MIAFCNAKINIGLRVLGKRPDGFHELQSFFIPIPIRDALELMESDKPGLRIHESGRVIPSDGGVNICQKAYDLLNATNDIPGLDLYLFKTIPVGAGLGGGSSNAAYMLKLLNDKFDLGYSNSELKEFGAQLGSDVPFFIDNLPSMVTGRGEFIEPFDVDLSGYWMQVVNPGIHCSTAEIFSRNNIDLNTEDLKSALLKPINEWQGSVVNDLEKPAIELYPEIGNLKGSLYDRGALYASMSGSGSTVFGLYKDKPGDWKGEEHSSWIFQL